jgi:hypothetical protein
MHELHCYVLVLPQLVQEHGTQIWIAIQLSPRTTLDYYLVYWCVLAEGKHKQQGEEQHTATHFSPQHMNLKKVVLGGFWLFLGYLAYGEELGTVYFIISLLMGVWFSLDTSEKKGGLQFGVY